MNPDKPCELESAGVDPDGFHEAPSAAVRGPVLPPRPELLSGGVGGESVDAEDVPADRPSGVYKKRGGRVAKPKRVIDQSAARPGADWLDGEELRVSVRKVGCFLLRTDGHHRHRVFNLLTGFQHTTFGSELDVDEEYTRQSASWAQKLSPEKKPHGSGWKNTNFPLPKS